MCANSTIAAFLSASLLSFSAFAQVPSASKSAEAPAGLQLRRTDLEAWLDGFIPYAIKRGNVAGAVVVVVKDGQVMLEKGYGYADVEKRTLVNPDSTMFRPASVSKLFTWTAVMQQVERGELDLDADVNQYLDFKIPPGPEGEPLRLRDIMTSSNY